MDKLVDRLKSLESELATHTIKDDHWLSLGRQISYVKVLLRLQGQIDVLKIELAKEKQPTDAIDNDNDLKDAIEKLEKQMKDTEEEMSIAKEDDEAGTRKVFVF